MTAKIAPSIYEGGNRAPTPEETVAVLLEQGDTKKQIIAEAEANIAEAEAGIEWVNTIASESSGQIDQQLEVLTATQEALNGLPDGAKQSDAYKEAENAVRVAALDVQILGVVSGAAKDAAKQHVGHASETIANAKRRIAAAQ